MDSLAFWLLVFPVLLVMALYYLGFLTAGLSFVKSAFKSRNPGRKFALLVMGISIISAPFLLTKFQHAQADKKADQRAEQIANLERINLAGRHPKWFVTVGGYQKTHIDLIKKESRMQQFPQAENDRLARAYRLYRRAEFCHSHSAGKTLSSNVKIPICRDLPESIQAVLNIKEPVLFFVEGASTSYLLSNTRVGNMFEVRLVTPTQDLLVDYYEDRVLERPTGITNPYSSGYKRDPDAHRLHIIEFIKKNLEGVRR